MITVIERRAQDERAVLFMCDFSPPRSSSISLFESGRCLDVDFLSVSYNPGKSVRVNSVISAYWIKENIGSDVIFTIATRDMNKLAIQSLLLGADLLGLNNVVVVNGDLFEGSELYNLNSVNDFKPTELISSIKAMNIGLDFRGKSLISPTKFCVGATIDLARDIENEISLTQKKIQQGTDFFILQSLFEPQRFTDFLEQYHCKFGESLNTLVFCGVQVMGKDSISFGKVPDWVRDDLDKGRTGEDLALETIQNFIEIGQRSIFLLPSITDGGERDYKLAQRVVEKFR